MLKKCACCNMLAVILLAAHTGSVLCSKLVYVLKHFSDDILFIKDFKEKVERNNLLIDDEQKELLRTRFIVDSVDFKRKWDILYKKMEEIDFFREQKVDDFLRSFTVYNSQDRLDTSKYGAKSFIIPKIAHHIEFFNIIAGKLTSSESFYRVVIANLFISFNQAISYIDTRIAKRPLLRRYSISPCMLPEKKLDKKYGLRFPDKSLNTYFLDHIFPRVISLFNYLNDRLDNPNRVIYKNIFNSFEVLYLLSKQEIPNIAQNQYKKTDKRANFIFHLKNNLKIVRFAILEYLNFDFFEIIDTDFILVYSKESIAKYAEKARIPTKKGKRPMAIPSDYDEELASDQARTIDKKGRRLIVASRKDDGKAVAAQARITTKKRKRSIAISSDSYEEFMPDQEKAVIKKRRGIIAMPSENYLNEGEDNKTSVVKKTISDVDYVGSSCKEGFTEACEDYFKDLASTNKRNNISLKIPDVISLEQKTSTNTACHKACSENNCLIYRALDAKPGQLYDREFSVDTGCAKDQYKMPPNRFDSFKELEDSIPSLLLEEKL